MLNICYNLIIKMKADMMIINNLTVENISNANEDFLNNFFKIINEIDSKLVNIINSKNLKIILADKISDVHTSDKDKQSFKNDLEKYEEFTVENSDELSHGLCSDTINALCIFSNTTKIPYIASFLYHEIGHYIDYYVNWGNENIAPCLSSKKEFMEAYKNDIAKYWDKIKNDNRLRLKHYIEDSTPEKLSITGLSETFAFCFARNNNKIEDVDIISDYFQETLSIAKKITDEYLINLH